MNKRVRINKNKYIGDNRPCYIIAEAGSNHNGSLEQAKKLIDVAKESGADAVKFQLFRAKTLYPNKEIEVKYLKNLGIKEGLYKIIQKFEMPLDWVEKLYGYAKERNIDFMATPFDLNSVRILNPYVDVFKVASYESMFMDLICAIKKTGKPIFISTGGSTDEEIDLLINKVLFDYLDKTVLLHCIAKYPAPLEQVSLNVIPYLAARYGVTAGYSDHTESPIIAPVVAVSLGAKVIEKHFTLSKSLPGPDHAFAVDPEGLRLMVASIRMAEQTINGNKDKKIIQDCERELYYYKRCFYIRRNLDKGQRIKKKDLIVLRNTGIQCRYVNPIEIDNVIGRILKRDKRTMDILVREDLE